MMVLACMNFFDDGNSVGEQDVVIPETVGNAKQTQFPFPIQEHRMKLCLCLHYFLLMGVEEPWGIVYG